MSYRFEYKRDLTNLPPKIRCDVGKEWKAPEHFSKTKLHKFANSLRQGGKVSASNSGIACRVHSGEPETMLKCDGPCGKTYGLDNFSRNTRVRGVYWCNDCTDWQGKNEPGYMPYPLPFAPRSDDDKKANTAGEAVDRGENLHNGDVADDVSSVAPSAVPSSVPSAEPDQSHVSSASFDGAIGSSAHSTTEGSVYSEDTYGPEPGRRGPVEFNAWGPDGVVRRITKAPTVVSEVSTTSTTSNTTVTKSGWVKPSMRKTPADAPDYIKFGRCNPTVDDDYHSADGLSDDEI